MNNITPEVLVSIGELMDKWTILTIKANVIKDEDKLENIMTELEILSNIVSPYQNLADVTMRFTLNNFLIELYEVNVDLWNIEDEIRDLEYEGVPLDLIKIFNTCGELANCINIDKMQRFVELARKVYITNDERCDIKRKINKLLSSKLIEEKSYKEKQ